MGEKLKKFLSVFCVINTGSIFGSLVFLAVFSKHKQVNQNIFWQVSLVAFVLTLVAEADYFTEIQSKKQAIEKRVIEYIAINSVLLAGAYLFQWINENYIIETLILSLIVFFVFIFVSLVSYSNDKKTADKLNEKIREKNQLSDD